VPVPHVITCIDCGGPCTLLSLEPESGWRPGDNLVYRCRDCHDRWDIELHEDDLADDDLAEGDGPTGPPWA
jgi:hypothetical protein